MADTLTQRAFSAETLPGSGDPAWLADRRHRALELFEALPLPSQETEEWRYTDLSRLDLDGFRPFALGTTAENLDDVPVEILSAAGTVGDRAGLLIQHNSTVAATQLDASLAERGVIFSSLDDALASGAHPALRQGLHDLVRPDRSKFTALHAAFRTGGTFVHVPRKVRVELPLQSLVYLDADGAAVFPHTVVVLEEGADLTFIERYVSPGLSRALSDAVVELYVGPAARLRHVVLQDWGTGVTHLSVQRARLGRDASLHSLAVAFGGDLSRTEVESVLAEPGAYSEMLGVYFAAGDQHYDHRTLQDHVAPHCTSDLLYKGALKGASRAIYSGWVTVRPNAQKTNAMQTNRNIVLSDRAKADSIPNLEIEANDVRCGHAASTGPVDQDTLFYIESRGLPRDVAERLVVTGFFQEVIDRVTLPEVADGVTQAIELELARE